jgi:hypothetical protein
VPETNRGHAPQTALQLALEVALQLARSGSQLGSGLESRFGSRISCSTVVGAIDCGQHIHAPSSRSANILKDVVHLVVFAAYLFLSIVP